MYCGRVLIKVAHHGIYFRQPPQNENTKSPKPLPQDIPPKKVEPRPLVCLGYVFDSSVVYMGDVSAIPDESWKMLDGLRPHAKTPASHTKRNGDHRTSAAHTSLEASLTDSVLALDISSTQPKSRNKINEDGSSPTNNGTGSGMFTPTVQPPLILIIDSLWPIRTHTSHYNYPQALTASLRLQANMTFLLGFSHPTSHYQWEELCLSIRGMDGQRPDHPDHDIAQRLIKDVWADEQFTQIKHKKDHKGHESGSLGDKLKRWGGRVEPGWDGLKLEVSSEGWREVETRATAFR